MSKQVIGILIAAALIAALLIWFPNREQGQLPAADSTGLPEDSQPGSALEPTDTRVRTRQAVVGEPVNPVIDRWGVPAGEVVQLTPEELARIRSEKAAAGIQGNVRDPSDAESYSAEQLGPGTSGAGGVGLAPEAADPGVMGAAPEAGVQQILGPAPEASVQQIVGPAPEASVQQIVGPAPDAGAPTIPGLAPEAGVPDILGPAPEASDPGTLGLAPEDGDIGPGGQALGTNGPPPEGY